MSKFDVINISSDEEAEYKPVQKPKLKLLAKPLVNPIKMFKVKPIEQLMPTRPVKSSVIKSVEMYRGKPVDKLTVKSIRMATNKNNSKSDIKTDYSVVEVLDPDVKKIKRIIPSPVTQPVQVKREFSIVVKETGNVAPLPQKNGENQECVVFRRFVDTCLEYDKSQTMKKIVESKVWRYYRNSNPVFRMSKLFLDLVAEKTEAIIFNPKNIFVPIKEVVDEMKARVLKDSEPRSKRQKVTDDDGSTENNDKDSSSAAAEQSESQPKASDRLIRRMCKILEVLHRKIKKLEEREVSWDDDEDSSYIQLQRYKERFCKVHQKLQEYEGETGDGVKSLRRRIVFTGTKFSTVNRAIEKFVNKKGEFPDFVDILKLLKATYEAENIPIKPEQLRVQAKAAFQDIGGQLQKQRQYDYWDSHCMYLQDREDPADMDDELKAKLQDNQEKHGGCIDEIIDKYVEIAAAQSHKVVAGDGEQAEDSTKDSEESDKTEKEEEEKENGSNEGEEEEVEEEDDDKDDDDEEEEEEDDFMDKVLNVDDDIKENLSTDGEDEVDDLNCYVGPVSPPSLDNVEFEIDEESCNSSSGPKGDSKIVQQTVSSDLVKSSECSEQTSVIKVEPIEISNSDLCEVTSTSSLNIKVEDTPIHSYLRLERKYEVSNTAVKTQDDEDIITLD